MTKRYYSLVQEGTTADIDIYGDITSWEWSESDVSAYNLSKRLDELSDVDTINVNINSYGGEVAEGLAIYNALKRHKARIVTRCDGFACSIASVIFMAGDDRVMNEASLLMIHNAWTWAKGNAAELRKQAEDLDTITQASKNAYLASVTIAEDELSALMDAEKWVTPQEALEWGFATCIEGSGDSDKPSQNARLAVFAKFMKDEDEDPDGAPDDEGGDPESDPEPDDGESGESDDDRDENPEDEKSEQSCRSFFLSAFKN